MAYSYKDLLVWQKSKALTVEVYRATRNFPRAELYGLQSQVRRAAVSVVSNIAEGQGRLTPGEFQQFLGHARGSLLEVETQLSVALDLGYLDAACFRTLELHIAEVLRMLDALIKSLHPSKARFRAAGAE